MSRSVHPPRPRISMPRTGKLSQVLEDARDRNTLQQFCSAHVCTTDQVSEDGKRLDLPRVLQLMRNRGHQVSDPVRAPHQPKRGFTAWLVHIQIPRAKFDIGFYTPDAANASVKKPHAPAPEHA